MTKYTSTSSLIHLTLPSSKAAAMLNGIITQVLIHASLIRLFCLIPVVGDDVLLPLYRYINYIHALWFILAVELVERYSVSCVYSGGTMTIAKRV